MIPISEEHALPGVASQDDDLPGNADEVCEQGWAASNLDDETASVFGETINQLRGKANILMIAHKLPANLQRMETVYLNQA